MVVNLPLSYSSVSLACCHSTKVSLETNNFVLTYDYYPVWEMCVVQVETKSLQPGLKPKLLDSESSALIITSVQLPDCVCSSLWVFVLFSCILTCPIALAKCSCKYCKCDSYSSFDIAYKFNILNYWFLSVCFIWLQKYTTELNVEFTCFNRKLRRSQRESAMHARKVQFTIT